MKLLSIVAFIKKMTSVLYLKREKLWVSSVGRAVLYQCVYLVENLSTATHLAEKMYFLTFRAKAIREEDYRVFARNVERFIYFICFFPLRLSRGFIAHTCLHHRRGIPKR